MEAVGRSLASTEVGMEGSLSAFWVSPKSPPPDTHTHKHLHLVFEDNKKGFILRCIILRQSFGLRLLPISTDNKTSQLHKVGAFHSLTGMAAYNKCGTKQTVPGNPSGSLSTKEAGSKPCKCIGAPGT